ncbi:hypothetical protein IT415_02515 [bacterium]|nr:hypothetical protein [bacterium]
MRTARRGIGVIEVIIILAILVIIGALVFVALKPKPTRQTSSNTSTQSVQSASDIKAAATEIDRQDIDAIDAELDSLTKDIGNL